MLAGADAIIFDLGGVVLNLNYDNTINAFKELGRENFEKLYTQSQQDQIFDRFETGEISAGEFRKYMKSFLQPSIEDFQIDEAWNAMLLDLPAERIDLLLRLKKTHRIFLFSNTNEIHYTAFRKIIKQSFGDENLLENVFHQTYYSHLVGQRKPNAAAFQRVLNDHELSAEKTIFVDDSIQHIEGAKKLSIQALHLKDQTILDLFSM